MARGQITKSIPIALPVAVFIDSASIDGMSLFSKELFRGRNRLTVNVEPDSEGSRFRAYCGGEVYTSAFVDPYGDKRQLDPPSIPWKTEWVPYEDANVSALRMVDGLTKLGFR